MKDKEDVLKVSNLLLAALLECGGARVTAVEFKHRYSEVSLDLTKFSKETLLAKTERLSRVVSRVEDDQEWKHLFTGCILGELEHKYIMLKRRIVKERTRR